MAPPFTFGIELEFSLACVTDRRKPAVERLDGRVIHFAPTKKDYLDARNSQLFDGESIEGEALKRVKCCAHQIAAQRDIKRRLRNSGISAERFKFGKERNVENWEVGFDSSVKGPEKSRLNWVDMEVVSPIYEFTPENLQSVKKVCDLLTKYYVTETNQTTGMHVHLGQGMKGFTFYELKNMLTFLWAFEPQMDTLHPPHRIDTYYARSMRSCSQLSHNWYKMYGEWPSASQAISVLSKCKRRSKLLETALRPKEDRKHSAYNFDDLAIIIEEDLKVTPGGRIKPTIEFRQHEGTLNAERAVNWISTIGGIATFLRDADPQSYTDLICTVQYEKWRKLYDGKDEQRESTMGPILAEGSFTVIDLLNYIGLPAQADFYSTRLYHHSKNKPVEIEGKVTVISADDQPRIIQLSEMPPLLTTWRHKEGDMDFEKSEKQRALWESMQRLTLIMPKNSGLIFNSHDAKWPPHETLELPESESSESSDVQSNSSTIQDSGDSSQSSEIPEGSEPRSDSSGMVDKEVCSEPSDLAESSDSSRS